MAQGETETVVQEEYEKLVHPSSDRECEHQSKKPRKQKRIAESANAVATVFTDVLTTPIATEPTESNTTPATANTNTTSSIAAEPTDAEPINVEPTDVEPTDVEPTAQLP